MGLGLASGGTKSHDGGRRSGESFVQFQVHPFKVMMSLYLYKYYLCTSILRTSADLPACHDDGNVTRAVEVRPEYGPSRISVKRWPCLSGSGQACQVMGFSLNSSGDAPGPGGGLVLPGDAVDDMCPYIVHT